MLAKTGDVAQINLFQIYYSGQNKLVSKNKFLKFITLAKTIVLAQINIKNL